jgi:hypothetical protein
MDSWELWEGQDLWDSQPWFSHLSTLQSLSIPLCPWLHHILSPSRLWFCMLSTELLSLCCPPWLHSPAHHSAVLWCWLPPFLPYFGLTVPFRGF